MHELPTSNLATPLLPGPRSAWEAARPTHADQNCDQQTTVLHLVFETTSCSKLGMLK